MIASGADKNCWSKRWVIAASYNKLLFSRIDEAFVGEEIRMELVHCTRNRELGMSCDFSNSANLHIQPWMPYALRMVGLHCYVADSTDCCICDWPCWLLYWWCYESERLGLWLRFYCATALNARRYPIQSDQYSRLIIATLLSDAS
jgi:hypothetical protein